MSRPLTGGEEIRSCWPRAHDSAGAAKRRAGPESDRETSPVAAPRVRLPVRSGRVCRPALQAGPPNRPDRPPGLLPSCFRAPARQAVVRRVTLGPHEKRVKRPALRRSQKSSRRTVRCRPLRTSTALSS